MKVLSSLRKLTKTGVSVWCFCYDAEMRVNYAIGGEDLKVIRVKDRKALRELYNNFLGYGYTAKLPKPKQQLVADPWESQLPLQLQHELAAL